MYCAGLEQPLCLWRCTTRALGAAARRPRNPDPLTYPSPPSKAPAKAPGMLPAAACHSGTWSLQASTQVPEASASKHSFCSLRVRCIEVTSAAACHREVCSSRQEYKRGSTLLSSVDWSATYSLQSNCAGRQLPGVDAACLFRLMQCDSYKIRQLML